MMLVKLLSQPVGVALNDECGSHESWQALAWTEPS